LREKLGEIISQKVARKRGKSSQDFLHFFRKLPSFSNKKNGEKKEQSCKENYFSLLLFQQKFKEIVS
jgi:hypothetical protein